MQLGFNITGSKIASSAVLNPGNYTVTAAGGVDVGAISAAITIPAGLNWTNRDTITIVTRSQGLPLTFTAPADQRVFIYGGVVDLPTNSSGVFYCVAPQGSSSFTVPAEILANVPASRRPLYKSKSVVYVGMSPAPGAAAAFSASGLDAGAAIPVYLSGKTVIFQ